MYILYKIHDSPRAKPNTTLKTFIVSTPENIGANTLAKNTRLRFEVKSASCFN